MIRNRGRGTKTGAEIAAGRQIRLRSAYKSVVNCTLLPIVRLPYQNKHGASKQAD